MKKILPVIFGVEGMQLTDEEKVFFDLYTPFGFILFDRNVKDPKQVKKLIEEMREITGDKNTPILVDQEGGRIQRFWPPYWEGLPFADTYGTISEEKSIKKGIKAVRKHAKKLAKMLLKLDVNVDCWPCLDIRMENVDIVLKKRLFSDDAETVSALGNAAVDMMLSKGLMPVIKHIPGYGRTISDPHFDLPVVTASKNELEKDFYPFKKANPHIFGMTAHVVYTAFDDQNPATLSASVIDMIRNDIGFRGLLLTDDIAMGALRKIGSPGEVAVKSLEAGCDIVLHCNGNLTEMNEIVRKLQPISPISLKRYERGVKELKK